MDKNTVLNLSKEWQKTKSNKTFEELVEEMKPMINSIKSKISTGTTGTLKVEKDELVQVSYIAIFNILSKVKIDEEKDISSYLYKSIKNAMIEYVNSEQNQIKIPRGAAKKIGNERISQINNMKKIEDMEAICDPNSLEEIVEDSILVKNIVNKIESFNEQDRLIATMRLFYGMSFSEIGKNICIPRATVFAKYKDIVKRLRETSI